MKNFEYFKPKNQEDVFSRKPILAKPFDETVFPNRITYHGLSPERPPFKEIF